MPEPSHNPQHTTAEALHRALEIYLNYQGGEPLVVALLHADIAEKALIDRGWHQRRRRGARGGPWVSPSGHCEGHTDHAFQLAITAETLEPAGTEDRDDEQRLRDLVTVVLERERPDDGADETVVERIVPTAHGPSVVVAASERRLVITSLAGEPTQLWHDLAGRLIAAFGDDNTNNIAARPTGASPNPQHRREPSP